MTLAWNGAHLLFYISIQEVCAQGRRESSRSGACSSVGLSSDAETAWTVEFSYSAKVVHASIAAGAPLGGANAGARERRGLGSKARGLEV
mmetsp:Transcript_17397/g.26177  ORF Transcript_17397/g.26177 Transcript_17397/m.26177 type:complete len:90 (-) Transcript_17397:444-713(-)